MGILTRDAIINADDLPRERVDVPEWGGHLFVRAFTGSERDELEAALIGDDGEKKRDTRGLRARFVMLSAVDDEGERLFQEADIEALGNKSANALDRCFDVARKLSGMEKEEVKKIEGNSDGDPNGASIFDSPEN